MTKRQVAAFRNEASLKPGIKGSLPGNSSQ